MTDRELLDAAARAIGCRVTCSVAEMHGCEDTSTVYRGVMLDGVQDAWSPLTDDGDALRLAVQLDLMVFPTDMAGIACVELANSPMHVAERHGPNKLAATRRAIVRAAAAMAESKTPNVGGEARLAAHQPSHTTTATPQGVASTDQLGGRVRSEKD